MFFCHDTYDFTNRFFFLSFIRCSSTLTRYVDLTFLFEIFIVPLQNQSLLIPGRGPEDIFIKVSEDTLKDPWSLAVIFRAPPPLY